MKWNCVQYQKWHYSLVLLIHQSILGFISVITFMTYDFFFKSLRICRLKGNILSTVFLKPEEFSSFTEKFSIEMSLNKKALCFKQTYSSLFKRKKVHVILNGSEFSRLEILSRLFPSRTWDCRKQHPANECFYSGIKILSFWLKKKNHSFWGHKQKDSQG